MGSSSKRVLLVLAAAQFLMVLDQAVMNVSISQLVADFDTDVTTIQAVITFYSLVMAALMITGGKLGDRWGRKRAFTIGMVVYAAGSALTAVSWTVGSLALGWSVLEGIGAALVLPAMVALVATNFEGRSRAAAFGVLGGVAGAGIAVGPILGGWMTTNLSWRLVFAGEVVVAAGILLGVRYLADEVREGPLTEVDWVGAALSAVGLGLVVFGVLQSSSWGFLRPRNSPIEPFGFSLTPFVIGAGAVVLALFVQWQRHREDIGREPLVRLEHLKIPPLRSGLSMFLAQNLILMGIFFTIPLYLQIVQGFDAFQTGLRMLPVSVTLFLTATLAPRLASRVSPRLIVRVGLVVLLARLLLPVERDRPRHRHRAVPRRDGRARRRHGAARVAARQRRAVVGRRVGAERGRRPAVHRAAARRRARHRAHGRDRHRRPRDRGREQHRVRLAHQRRDEAADVGAARGRACRSSPPTTCAPPPRTPGCRPARPMRSWRRTGSRSSTPSRPDCSSPASSSLVSFLGTRSLPGEPLQAAGPVDDATSRDGLGSPTNGLLPRRRAARHRTPVRAVPHLDLHEPRRPRRSAGSCSPCSGCSSCPGPPSSTCSRTHR